MLSTEARKLIFAIRDVRQRTDLTDSFEERVGICVHDGGLSVAQAEAVALAEVVERIKHPERFCVVRGTTNDA